MNSWEKIPSNTRHKWTNATQYMQYQYSVLSRNKSFGGEGGKNEVHPRKGSAVLLNFFMGGKARLQEIRGTNLDTKPSK